MKIEELEKNIRKNIQKIIPRLSEEDVKNKMGEFIDLIAKVVNPNDMSFLIEELMKIPEYKELLESKWEKIVYSSKDSNEVIRVLEKDEKIREKMINQFQRIVATANITSYPDLAQGFTQFENGLKVVLENFEILAQKTKKDYDTLYMCVLGSEEGRKTAKKNYSRIRDMAPLSEFFNFIRSIKNIDEFSLEYENFGYWAELYEQIKIPSPEDVLAGRNYNRLSHDEQLKYGEYKTAEYLKEKIFFNLLFDRTRFEKQMILQEVAKGREYEYYTAGSSSIVLKIDDIIVKLGTERRNFAVPYHPRLIMPIFRKEYGDATFIEISNFAERSSPEITDEKLLEIYKELEEAGILWSDARKNNLVVLKKDNELPDFIASKEFNVFGFLEDARFPTTEHKALKKGDIVICDLDMLYAKGDPNYEEGNPAPIIKKYIKKNKEKYKNETDYYIGK